jgi:hypothetical protein
MDFLEHQRMMMDEAEKFGALRRRHARQSGERSRMEARHAMRMMVTAMFVSPAVGERVLSYDFNDALARADSFLLHADALLEEMRSDLDAKHARETEELPT